MSNLKKVKITEGNIYADGVKIGTIGSGSEIWVHGVTGVEGERDAFVARFKYFNPRTKANKFIKFVFARLTMPEYLAKLAVPGSSPVSIANELGMPPPEPPKPRAPRSMKQFKITVLESVK